MKKLILLLILTTTFNIVNGQETIKTNRIRLNNKSLLSGSWELIHASKPFELPIGIVFGMGDVENGYHPYNPLIMLPSKQTTASQGVTVTQWNMSSKQDILLIALPRGVSRFRVFIFRHNGNTFLQWTNIEDPALELIFMKIDF